MSTELRIKRAEGTYRIRTVPVGQSFGCVATVGFRSRTASPRSRYVEVYETLMLPLGMEHVAEARAVAWIDRRAN